jgi:hypothetical protein
VSQVQQIVAQRKIIRLFRKHPSLHGHNRRQGQARKRARLAVVHIAGHGPSDPLRR